LTDNDRFHPVFERLKGMLKPFEGQLSVQTDSARAHSPLLVLGGREDGYDHLIISSTSSATTLPRPQSTQLIALMHH
jgi:hypothetical protein